MHYTKLISQWLEANVPTKCPDHYPQLPKWVRNAAEYQSALHPRLTTPVRSNHNESFNRSSHAKARIRT